MAPSDLIWQHSAANQTTVHTKHCKWRSEAACLPCSYFRLQHVLASTVKQAARLANWLQLTKGDAPVTKKIPTLIEFLAKQQVYTSTSLCRLHISYVTHHHQVSLTKILIASHYETWLQNWPSSRFGRPLAVCSIHWEHQAHLLKSVC